MDKLQLNYKSMKIIRDNSLLLIIDIQEKLFPYIYKNEELRDRTNRLIEGCKTLGLKIIVTEQYTKGLGLTISPLRESLEGAEVIEKTSFSCCGSTSIDAAIKAADKEFIIIAGIESHVCVLQTVIDLCSMGYTPVIVDDCVSSRNPNDKSVAIERMRKEGALISTYESILFELLGDSKAPEFKTISKIVK